MSIREHLDAVEARIGAACERAGRDRGSVRLVAVSKTQPPEAVCEAAAAGQLLFGENRVQEAQAKIPHCPGSLQWHLVGHLQSNKVKIAANLFRMIHSVDSEKLLSALDEHAAAPLPVLVQVNISGEGSKSGCAPDETARLVEAANACSRVEVHGLMTLPPFTPEPGRARRFFASLRELRDRVQAQTGTPLPELSMGMSHDFEIAIEEGATLIRIGTAIFGGRT